MEKKEAAGNHNSLWPLLGCWHVFKSFLFGFFHKPSPRNFLGFSKSGAGFTLVELVVVLAMVATLATLLIMVIDPVAQVNKAKDTARKHDLAQIRSTLDVYYNDHNCYPMTVPFGQQWKEGATVYMAKVPQDPDYPKNAYAYEMDASKPCPQWVALFSNLSMPSENSLSCGLPSMSNCTPTNYQPTFSCLLAGSVDCGYISTNPVNFPIPTPTPTPTLSPTPTPTPTPTSCSLDYACTGSPSRCNIVGTGQGEYCSSNCDGACL